MFRVTFLAVAAALLLSTGQVQAITYTTKVINITGEKMIGIKVMGRGSGEVLNFTPTNAKEFKLTVDLPDNAGCRPVVRFLLSSQRKFEGRVNFCGGYDVEIAWPWSPRN